MSHPLRAIALTLAILVVAPALEVHGQLCGNVAGLDAIPSLHTLTNAAVQVYTLRR